MSQLPLSLAYGGVEVQVLRTADALRSVGVDVELLDPWKMSFDGDLLHCFTSEYQIAEVVAHAKGLGIPVVTSAVFSPRRSIAAYRAWRLVDRLVPLKTSFGLRGAVLRESSAVIALTRREAAVLVSLFRVPEAKVHVIGNGVDAGFFTATPGEFVARFGLVDCILCVAWLGRRKNQHRLLEAVGEMGPPVVLIGPTYGKEPGYAQEIAARVACMGPAVRWLGSLPQDSSLLVSAFAAAKVFVLPSLAEIQPLSVLQAAAAGANIVVSDLPHLRETFGDYVWYCDPTSVSSIRRAVGDAYQAPRGVRYTSAPPWLLSWRDVAVQVRRVYEAVLTARSR